MEVIKSYQRQRTLKKMQSAAGVRAGGRHAGRGLALRPSEPAEARTILQEDAAPNLRVWQMVEEAESFESDLQHFRTNVQQFEAATDEFLSRLEPILRAPLPRVWDSVEGGLAEPTRATVSHQHANTVGGDASVAGLEEARSELHNRLRGHILRPLDQWSDALAVVEERLPQLSKLRGEVLKRSRRAAASSKRYHKTVEAAAGADSAGQLVNSRPPGGGGVKGLFGSCLHPRTGGSRRNGGGLGRGGGYSDSDDEADTVPSVADHEIRREVASEEAGMKLNYKHRKLEAARGDYAEIEGLLASQLSGLCRDAAWLKSYVVATLLIHKEAMQCAVVSLGNTKQPLPGFAGRCGMLGGQEHGVLRDNIALVADMPQNLAITPPSSEGNLLLPSAGLHAHRATAQPMELAARPDMRAMDRVKDVSTGAAAIPMSAIEGEPQVARALEDIAAMGGSDQDLLPQTTSFGGSSTASGLQQAAAGSPTVSRGGRGSALGGRRDVQAGEWGSGVSGSTGVGGTASLLSQGESTRAYKSSQAGAFDSGGLGRAEDREGLRERGRGVVSAIEAEAAGAGGVGGGLGSAGGSGGLVPGATLTVPPGVVLGSTSSRSGAAADGGIGHHHQHHHAGGLGVAGLGSSSGAAAAGGGSVSVLREDANSEFVCSRQEFSEVEDRPVLKERVLRVIEHHPVAKEYVTTVKYVGEEAAGVGATERVGAASERVVSVAEPGPKCPTAAATAAAADGGSTAADIDSRLVRDTVSV